jgi:predicted dehydrogenase
MVGFNRRFSPAADAARAFFARRSGPLLVHVRANAGFLPASHWTQDPAIGGGRIIGEGCHYIDLLQTLIAADPIEVHAVSTQLTEGAGQDDNVVIVCRYADGSLGTITYVSTGDKMFPKERVEMFAEGSVFVIDDFSSTTSVRRGKTDTDRRSGQDKGHAAELARFMDAVRTGGPDPIPFRELYLTTSLSLLAMESLRAGMPLAVPRIVAG